MKKLILGILAAIVSNPALAVTPVAGSLLAIYLGFDPWTWIIGGLGGAVARVKLPPATKSHALWNGVISVMLAGLGSEYAAAVMTFEKLPAPNIYLMAFALSTLWPWGASLAKARIEKWSSK